MSAQLEANQEDEEEETENKNELDWRHSRMLASNAPKTSAGQIGGRQQPILSAHPMKTSQLCCLSQSALVAASKGNKQPATWFCCLIMQISPPSCGLKQTRHKELTTSTSLINSCLSENRTKGSNELAKLVSQKVLLRRLLLIWCLLLPAIVRSSSSTDGVVSNSNQTADLNQKITLADQQLRPTRSAAQHSDSFDAGLDGETSADEVSVQTKQGLFKGVRLSAPVNKQQQGDTSGVIQQDVAGFLGK